MDGHHVGVCVSCYHGKGVFTSYAADENNLLPRNAKFILTLDKLSRFRRWVGFFPVCLEEGKDGEDAAPMLYGFSPHWLCSAFNARVEYNSRFPGFLESP